MAGANPAMIIRIAATLEEFKRNLKEGRNQVETLTSAFTKLSSSFSGDKLIQHAHNVAAAIQNVGGVTKLTAAEQARANTVIERALEKYRALGQQAPIALQNIADATKKADDTTKSWAQTIGTDFKARFAAMVAGFISAQAIIAGVRMAWGLLTDFIVGSIDSYSRAEAAQKRLTTALQAQGTATPATIRQFEALAAQFQRTTIYSDDLITEMQALLVQVGGVLPSEMSKALGATTNLASGLGIDLRAATMMVSKAFEDNFASLKKAGVEIDIARAKAEGMTYVLGQIQAKFGGQAQADLETYAGQVAHLANEWDNLKEAVGRLLVQGLNLPEWLSRISDGLSAVNAALITSEGKLLPLINAITIFVAVVTRSKDAQLLAADAFQKSNAPLASHTTLVDRARDSHRKLAPAIDDSARADKAFRDSVDRSWIALLRYTELMPALRSGYESWIQRGIEANGLLQAGIPLWYGTAAATRAVGKDLDAGTFNLNAWILSLKQLPPEIVKVKQTTEDWLFATRDLFDALGALTGSSFIQWLGDVADGMARGAQAGKAMAKALDEHDWAGFVAGAAQAVVALDQATQSASKAKRAIGGAMTGASIGSAFGPWGTVIGAVAGAIVGLVRHVAVGRDAVKEFAASFGGFDALHVKLLALGTAGEQLWINLTQGVGSNNPAQAKAAIDAITAAFAGTPAAMAAASYQTRAELQAIADKAQAVYQFMLDSGQYTAQALAAAFQASKDAQIAALDELSAHDKAVADLVKGFSGQAVIDQATIMVDAIAKIGGVATLTEAELANVNTVVADAIAKYKLLGQIAPQAMIDLYNATLPVESATAKVTAATQALLDKRKSLMDSIANEAPEAVMGAVEQATRDQIAAVDAQIKKVKDAAAKSVAAGKTTVLSYEDLINRGINPATIAATGVGTAVEQAADRAHIAVMAMIADAEDLAAAYYAVPPPGGASSGGPASGSSVPSSATSSATTSSGGSRSSSSTMTTRGGASVGPVHIHIAGAQSPTQAHQAASAVADELIKLLDGNVGGRRTKTRKVLRVV